jgi:hypothetical protein
MTLQQLAQNAMIEWGFRYASGEISLEECKAGIERIAQAQAGALK